MRILLAEADAKLGNKIKHMLEEAANQVDWVVNGDMAFEYALHAPYDVVILDWMIPGQTSISICKSLRIRGYRGAILMLMAKEADQDRIADLSTSADACFVKSIELTELLAQVQALARRSRARMSDEILQVGNLIFNCVTYCVRQGETEIQLTSREFQLLDLLVRNQERVVPREFILERIWGVEAVVSSNNLDAYVRLLRKKLRMFNNEVIIQTIRGIGYKLKVHDVCQNR
jgi:DNA-binding response OmpR family regulator